MRDAHLIEQYAGRPLLLEPKRAASIGQVLMRHADGVTLNGSQIDDALRSSREARDARIARVDAAQDNDGTTVAGGKSKVINGVAVIPIHGILQKRGGLSGDISSDGVGTQAVGRELELALNDGRVRAILLDIDSPGGAVDGTFELADAVFDARGTKPIGAYCNGLTASGGYAVACSADPGRVVTYRSGEVGSIGVIIAFLESRGAWEKLGYTPHVITSGELKASGHPLIDHDKPRLADLQRISDALYEQFVQTVERGRGISAKQVRATEARLYIGHEAVEQGLVDEIGSFGDLLASLAEAAGQQTQTQTQTQTEPQGAHAMTTTQTQVRDRSPVVSSDSTKKDDAVKDDDTKKDDVVVDDDDTKKDDAVESDDDDDDKKTAQAIAQEASANERARSRQIAVAAKELGFPAGDPLVEEMLDSGQTVKGAGKILAAAAGSRKTSDPMAMNYESQTPLLGQPTAMSNAQLDPDGTGAGAHNGVSAFAAHTHAAAQQMGVYGDVDPDQAALAAARNNPSAFMGAVSEHSRQHPSAKSLLATA